MNLWGKISAGNLNPPDIPSFCKHPLAFIFGQHNALTPAAIENLDVMMAKRKIALNNLSESVDRIFVQGSIFILRLNFSA